MSKIYNNDFYKDRHVNTVSSAERILELTLDFFRNDMPTSAIDIGCGVGTWLSVLRNKEIAISGWDGEWVPQEHLRIDSREFAVTKLDIDLADRNSALWNTPPSDLLITLEVAEHIPADSAPLLVDFVTTHSRYALFSAAIPGQTGDGHVNEQWPSYWANLFFSKKMVCS